MTSSKRDLYGYNSNKALKNLILMKMTPDLKLENSRAKLRGFFPVEFYLPQGLFVCKEEKDEEIPQKEDDNVSEPMTATADNTSKASVGQRY